MIVLPITPVSSRRTSGEYRNYSAFAALKLDGSVVTWGRSTFGGDSSAVASQLGSGVRQIFSNEKSFAALKVDGSLVTWGSSGGDSSAVFGQLRSGVSQVFSTKAAFAALKIDGSVVTWGASTDGGDSSAVASQLSSGVSRIFSTGWAFAALKTDGSVVTWGSPYGGSSSRVASQLSSGVSQIASTVWAFAALKTDGSVVTWGGESWGGDSSAVVSQLRSGVSQIFSTSMAFAALKTDGSVVTWGASTDGGNSSAVASQLRSGVIRIFSNDQAFAALKADGSVVTWGSSTTGGDSSAVASQLSSGVSRIFSTGWAFAALKTDGSVVTWGDSTDGGDSSAVASQLRSNVTNIFFNNASFAALKADGSVVTWGRWGADTSSVANQLSSGVSKIFATDFAFAALKLDGSVVTWGNYFDGGDSSDVASQILAGVVGFANPFSDDWLDVGSLATVTLAVSQEQVIEDANINLIYTFSRAGDTSNPLTVIYQVAGNASPIDDYSGIGGATLPPITKTLTFSAGASTVTLVIDPTADGLVEPDESVILSLQAHHSYAVGAASSALATIRDDDSRVTLTTVGAVAFQFAPLSRRYSVSIGGLDKPITIQGTPIYEAIYPLWRTLSAASINGVNTVLWLNTEHNRLHTWFADANWSWLSSQGWIDPDSSEGYTLESQFRLDLNQDTIIGSPYRAIASVGSVVLQQNMSTNRYSVSIDGSIKPITIQGHPIYEGIYPSWRTLSAASINGVNTVLWHNVEFNRLHTWTTDSNWSWLSSQGWIDPSSPEGSSLEVQFQLDLNQNSTIGTAYETITRAGSVLFQKALDSSQYSVVINGLIKPITIQGHPIYEGIYPSWRTLSAASINGANTVLWHNVEFNRLHTWSTDSNWSWLSSQGWIDPVSIEAFALESQFSMDLNNDTMIGPPSAPLDNLRSRITLVDPTANASRGFASIITGTSAADNFTATSSSQLLTGYDLHTGVATYAGTIDVLDGGHYAANTFLVASPVHQPYALDGDQGFTWIRNFRLGSDDLVLDATRAYVFAARDVQAFGATVSGLGVHLDSNANGSFDLQDNLIALLSYGVADSASGGNIPNGTSTFGGRLVLI